MVVLVLCRGSRSVGMRRKVDRFLFLMDCNAQQRLATWFVTTFYQSRQKWSFIYWPFCIGINQQLQKPVGHIANFPHPAVRGRKHDAAPDATSARDRR